MPESRTLKTTVVLEFTTLTSDTYSATIDKTLGKLTPHLSNRETVIRSVKVERDES